MHGPAQGTDRGAYVFFIDSLLSIRPNPDLVNTPVGYKLVAHSAPNNYPGHEVQLTPMASLTIDFLRFSLLVKIPCL